MAFCMPCEGYTHIGHSSSNYSLSMYKQVWHHLHQQNIYIGYKIYEGGTR